MSPDCSSFTAINGPSSFSLPAYMDYFTLSATPNTDLWRSPPNTDISTAPVIFTSLQRPFVIAEVTLSADWEMERDQGGLVIFAGDAPSESSSDAHSHKWVKAGMEFSSDKFRLTSASATSDGADGFSFPLPPNITSLRVKFERVGSSLWVWYQIPSQLPYATTPEAVQATWEKLREVTWFFHGVADKCVHVGVYASRPIRITDSDIGGERLVMTFEDFEILLQPSQ